MTGIYKPWKFSMSKYCYSLRFLHGQRGLSQLTTVKWRQREITLMQTPWRTWSQVQIWSDLYYHNFFQRYFSADSIKEDLFLKFTTRWRCCNSETFIKGTGKWWVLYKGHSKILWTCLRKQSKIIVCNCTILFY